MPSPHTPPIIENLRVLARNHIWTWDPTVSAGLTAALGERWNAGTHPLAHVNSLTTTDGTAGDHDDSFVLVPGDDMHVAARLCAGSDMWLDNPVRPQEACGTSGEKAALNGGINCSIADGSPLSTSWVDRIRSGWTYLGPKATAARMVAESRDRLYQPLKEN